MLICVGRDMNGATLRQKTPLEVRRPVGSKTSHVALAAVTRGPDQITALAALFLAHSAREYSAGMPSYARSLL